MAHCDKICRENRGKHDPKTFAYVSVKQIHMIYVLLTDIYVCIYIYIYHVYIFLEPERASASQNYCSDLSSLFKLQESLRL